MKFAILLIAVVAVALAGVAARAMFRPVKHYPLEYYSWWSVFYEPIRLSRKITKEEADALSASGYAYLTGQYDAEGRLVKAVKYAPGGEVFFAIDYTYRPGGRLLSATMTAHGRTSVYDYDARGRRRVLRSETAD